ncbi:uncharacterized protein LOC123296228 [Chrysoperla carnea]|uniref:uncharacterized protein LOC123296228 n=1 Tax=Chrysoperla carnea TaxID=189513 RepID=UPI001D064CDE|nr:uncharacterized protein LOC123296228 [Chrysoperla carnea]
MLIELLLLVVSLIGIFIINFTWKYDYWKKRGIPYEKPIFPFGSIKDSLLGKKTLCTVVDELYYKYKDYKYFGLHFGRLPILFLRDPQLSRSILVKYFNHFQDNAARLNAKNDPIIGNNPFLLKGNKWKIARAHITPGFTALKIKQMFPNMASVSERLVAYIQQNIDASTRSLEAKEVASNFTTEVFTLSALNIKSDSFENPNSSFKTISNKMFVGTGFFTNITWTLMIVDPPLLEFIGTRMMTKEGEAYFRNAINDILVHREKNNLEINDFLNYLSNLQLKNKGNFTRDDVVSNIVSLFLDGVETSAATIRAFLYEVAANSRVFEKLREEIDTIKAKYNNEITYDAIQEMAYLDSCLQETLRINSIVFATVKECTEPFEFPPLNDGESGLKIDKGVSVLIPVHPIQHDSDFYSDPEEFKPERFYNDETKIEARANFFGFGDGPRMCLGMRYGSLVTKLAIATIVSNFDVAVNEKIKERPKNVGASFMFVPSVEPIIDFHKRLRTIKVSEMWVDLLLLVASLLGIFTIFYTWNYDYWKKRQLPFVKPIFPFGSIKDVILLRKTFSSLLDDLYYKYKDYKYIGMYFGRHPVLFIRDANLARDVMMKHFNHFHDNAARISEKADPIAGNNPFILKGAQWKTTRAHLTPGFTTLKLKQMFPNMSSVSERLIAYIQQHIDSSKNSIEAKELSGSFATEVFTLAALNIKSDSFENPKSPFKTIANDLLAGSPLKLFITWTLTVVDPALAVLLRIRLLPKKAEMYFRNAISDVLSHRERNNLVFNDFCNYLNNLQLKNSDFTRDDVVSNMVTIFLDGVETAAQVIRVLLREVAAYPDVYKKLRDEVDTIKSKYNDQITFDGLQEMTYLDGCLFETLRIYGVLLASMRVCTQTFEFPPPKEGEPALKIEPGIGVILPLYSIHHDEKIHPKPEEFNPDRFNDEETKEQAKANFYGFGAGPRQCLGMRYGSLVVKLGIATIISNFDVTLNEKTKERPENISPSFLFSPSFEPILDFHKRGKIYK